MFLPFCHVPWPFPPAAPRMRFGMEERVVRLGVGIM
jgi:hypothetical protein